MDGDEVVLIDEGGHEEQAPLMTEDDIIIIDEDG